MSHDLEHFFDLSVDIMCLGGPDGFFKRVNAAFEATVGWPAQELLSRPFVEFVHPEDVDSTLAEIEKLEAGLPTISFENRFRCADGSYRTLSWSAFPDHESGLLYSVARDVTEAQRAGARFRMALDASPAGMLMVDPAGFIRRANRAVETLLGYEVGELDGTHVEALLPLDLRAQHAGHRHDYLSAPVYASRPMGQERDLRALRKDGTTVEVEIGLNPMEVDGELNLLLGILDVTSRKVAEAYLQKSRDDLLAVLNGLREGALMMDSSGQVIFANQTAAALLGLEPEACIGLHWHDLLGWDPAHLSTVDGLLDSSSESDCRVEIPFTDRAGRRHVVELGVQGDPGPEQHRLLYLYDRTEVVDLRTRLEDKTTFNNIVGTSAAIRTVFEQVRLVAPLDWTVLIQGETGTGKELAARAIHSQSRRREGPFVPVNCAALSESLLTSQLFGHRRGAFTGALADQKGVFEAASGGTIFLDEIGDMPLPIQTSLLRVLQEREITRLGESVPRGIDVRVLAATHCDLKQKVEEGSFRADLFYRIHGHTIILPPLRDRPEDIPPLAHHFARIAGTLAEKQVPEISKEALDRLVTYPWPGNVRELRGAIEVAVVRSGGIVRIRDLPPEVAAYTMSSDRTTPSPDDERVRILRAIEEAGGNRSDAARRLGISRATLYRRLDDLDVGPKAG